MVKTFKVLIIGEGAVGKTSIATRYTTGGFKESHLMTVGANFMLKNLELKDGSALRLSIWDTAGQEKFRKIVETYYKGGKGVLVCFDVTNRKSFEEIDYWFNTSKSKIPDAKICLIGTKIDLDVARKVSKDEALSFAKELNLPYFETSALKNLGISEAFEYLSEQMIKEEKV